MKLCLAVPKLFFPRVDGVDAYRGLHLPALEKLLGRSERSAAPGESLESWLCRTCGIARQHDWPVGPLSLVGQDIDPGEDFWLCADPVHLQVNRHELILSDQGISTLSTGEASAIAETLNAHWREEGLELLVPEPTRWYLRTATAPELRTVALPDALDRGLHAQLPAGADAARWHRALTDAQMLLANHPVNTAREQRGEPAVNSLWFWGGGRRPVASGRTIDSLSFNDPLGIGIARACNGTGQRVPPSFARWLEGTQGRGEHMIVLDQLRSAVQRGDVASWRGRLLWLERDWFVPTLALLARRGLEEVRVVAVDAHAVLEFAATRKDLRRFWRRSRPLAAHQP